MGRGTVCPFTVMLHEGSSSSALWITPWTNGSRELNMRLELLEPAVMVKETAGTTPELFLKDTSWQRKIV